MLSQVTLLAFVACLAGPVFAFKSVSINSPVAGSHINPIGAYANTGFYNQGYNGYFGSPYYAPSYIGLENSHSSVSGVNPYGGAFDAYHSSSPFGFHQGSSSYNPYLGSKSFKKVSSVPGHSSKVSHEKTPFGSSFNAHQTVGIPGLPGSYTVSTKTTTTKHPVVYPTFGHFANFGGYGYPSAYPAGALAYGVSPYGFPQQIRYPNKGYRGHRYGTLSKLTGYRR